MYVYMYGIKCGDGIDITLSMRSMENSNEVVIDSLPLECYYNKYWSSYQFFIPQ